MNTIRTLEVGVPREPLTPLEWVFLVLLLLGWPGLSWWLMPSGADSLSALAVIPRHKVYLQSMVLTWSIVLLLFVVLRFRRAEFFALGFGGFTFSNLLTGVALFIGANVVLFLFAVALPSSIPQTDDFVLLLLPRTAGERILWLGLSLTAAVGEETIFRGYLLTRLNKIFHRWTPAVLISSLGFGLAHLYQGWAGVLMTGMYGVLFCFVYLRRGSLWPCITAHFLQDAVAILPLGLMI